MKKSEKFIKTQEVLEELLKSGVINDPECIDDIIYHLEGSLTRLHYWKTELDEIYDQEYDCWSWICESITVLYAFDFNVLIFIYENELRDIKKLVVKRAPKWFEAGWVGLTTKSLSEEAFNNYYCNLRNNNCFKKVNFELESKELKGNYLSLKAVKSRIKDFLEVNPQIATIIKNVAV